MRPTCTDCAIKHIAQASILLQEARHGYPDHIFYSRGHLAEAEAELAQLYPAHSDKVRFERKMLEQNIDYTPDFTALMKQIDEECEVCTLAGNPRSSEVFTPWTSCELKNPGVQEKILSCVKKVSARGDVADPVAVCRSRISCPGG